MDVEDLKAFRDRFHLDISDEHVERAGYRRPADDSAEMRYLKQRRSALGGPLPARRRQVDAPLAGAAARGLRPAASRAPESVRSRPRWSFVETAHDAAARRASSATGSCRSCPTSRAPSAWRACSADLGIYSHVGQLYEPVDADELASYREDGRVRFSRKASTRPGRSRAGSRPGPPTRTTTCR